MCPIAITNKGIVNTVETMNLFHNALDSFNLVSSFSSIFCSFSIALYPAFSIAATISAVLTFELSYSIVSFSVA
ncbi:hypothetical protein D3C73_1401800 [compost metagenome]